MNLQNTTAKEHVALSALYQLQDLISAGCFACVFYRAPNHTFPIVMSTLNCPMAISHVFFQRGIFRIALYTTTRMIWDNQYIFTHKCTPFEAWRPPMNKRFYFV